MALEPPSILAEDSARAGGGALSRIEHWWCDLQALLGPSRNPVVQFFAPRCDIDTLHAAILQVYRRHSALASNFVGRSDARRRTQGAADLALVHDSLGAASPAAARQYVSEIVEQARLQPYELAHGPLFRARTVACTDGATSVILAAHHAVSDRWSFAVLMREICTLAVAPGDPARWSAPPSRVSYSDFVRREQAASSDYSSAEIDALIEAGGRSPSGAPATGSADRQRGSAEGWVEITLPAPALTRLRHFARSRAASMQAVMLALYGNALRSTLGGGDLLIGLYHHGRPSMAYANTVGCFAVNAPIVYGADALGSPGDTHDLMTRLGGVYRRAASIDFATARRANLNRVVLDVWEETLGAPARSTRHQPMMVTPRAGAGSGPVFHELCLQCVLSSDHAVLRLSYGRDWVRPELARRITDQIRRSIDSASQHD